MNRVRDKVAIVTGGASGIGRATALLLAREGASVTVADLDVDRARQVADEILTSGGTAIAQQVDVAEEYSVKAMIESTVEYFGGVHILFNNAALTSASHHALDIGVVEMEVEHWDKSMAVNLRGPMLGCKYAIPHMVRAGGGAIVNTSSNQSLAGDLTQSAYSASKAAVNQLTRTIATRYGREGIRCNTVSPGLIRTEGSQQAVTEDVFEIIKSHNLIARTGQPDDLAWAVLFLVSDESSFITGQLLSVDGGQMAHLPHYADLNRFSSTTTKS